MITVLALLLAADPLGFVRVWPKRHDKPLLGAVVLAAAAGLADPVLDGLDLSPEGFWIAAGLVLLVPAFGRLLAGEAGSRDVAGPAAPLVAMALATRDGLGLTLAAVGVVLLGAWLAASIVRADARWPSLAERFVGAGMVVVAFDLVRDGVIAV